MEIRLVGVGNSLSELEGKQAHLGGRTSKTLTKKIFAYIWYEGGVGAVVEGNLECRGACTMYGKRDSWSIYEALYLHLESCNR